MKIIKIPIDIDSLEGTRVKLNPDKAYGSENDRKYAEEYLKENKVYTIDYTDIHGWHTNVYLKEFPNKYFNSVVLMEVEE